MENDYSEKGPCCAYHEKLKAKYEGQIRGILCVLGGGNPRKVHQLYDIITQQISPYILAFALSPKCICNEHPNPPFFRKMMGKVLVAKRAGLVPSTKEGTWTLTEESTWILLDKLADEVLDEANMTEEDKVALFEKLKALET
jgi:hypothetical protein